jgi:hypothetical protein
MGIRMWWSKLRQIFGEEQGTTQEERDCFLKVLRAEHETIAQRRTKRDGSKDDSIKSDKGSEQSADQERIYDTTGVCLSGGGIRSAAFCLGALQSLTVRAPSIILNL